MSTLALPFPFIDNTWTSSEAKAAVIPVGTPVSIQRLIGLLDERGEDDYGQIGPSQLAFKNALTFLLAAISLVGEDIPSSPVVDSEGGIRITWRRGNKQVKLICPATRDAEVYVYYSSPRGNGLSNQGVTPLVLAQRLDWLTERESAATAAG
ncbi:MAG TPA: hypothetical protein VLI55_10250 [Bryobacteraceae bacterium]|nr:hypothetical protein [Bryobacteraceae bacterium]